MLIEVFKLGFFLLCPALRTADGVWYTLARLWRKPRTWSLISAVGRRWRSKVKVNNGGI